MTPTATPASSGSKPAAGTVGSAGGTVSAVRAPRRDWPILSDFSKTLQNPRFAFKLPALQAVTVERTPRGQPRPWTGAFAVVFRGNHAAGGSVALRAFTSDVPERIERYAAIGSFLTQKRPTCMVGFEFHAEGIQAKGQWFPLIVMDWVSGDVLFEWVKHRCLAGDRAALAAICTKWFALVAELDALGIAHGDLQHANVMVTDGGELKLVDYDCMAVPALFGRVNLEIGVDPYQHPERTGATVLEPTLDRFSALFIATALKALAAEPGLWAEYVEPPVGEAYDKLLIKAEDLAAPSASSLARRLAASPDPDVRELWAALLARRNGPVKDVPPLAAVLASFAKVEALLAAGDFDAAAAMADQFGPARMAQAPAALNSRVAEARARVACRQALEAAAARGDEATLAAQYKPQLLAGYPAANAVAVAAQQAVAVLPALKAVADALARNDGRAAVAAYDAQRGLLAGRPSAAALTGPVEQWRERNRLCDAAVGLLGLADPAGAAVSAAWQALERAGGHPDATPHRARAMAVVKRFAAWQRFQAVPQAVGEAGDRALLAAWDEAQFAGWPPAERERPRLAPAQQRLATLTALRPLLAGEGEAAERQIAAAAPRLPAGYAADVTARATAAAARVAALDGLRAAVAARPVRVRDVAKAWVALDAAGGAALAAVADRQAAAVATRQYNRLLALKKLPEQPIDEREQGLLKAYDPRLLDGCPEAAAWKAEFKTATDRAALIAKLAAALTANRPLEASELLDHPLILGHPLPPELASRVPGVRSDTAELSGMSRALAADDPAGFRAAFSAATVRKFPTAFAKYRDRLRTFLAGLLGPGGVGPEPPAYKRPGVAPAGAGAVVLKWRWPEPRFTDTCRVTVSSGRPGPRTRPDDLPLLVDLTVTRREYEDGRGITIRPERHWGGAVVAVWLEVDVGEGPLTGAPLVLGSVGGGGGGSSDDEDDD